MIMKKIVALFAGTLVASATALTAVVGAERDVLDNWKSVVSTNDFKKTLASVRAVQEDWPAVHSIKHKESKNAETSLIQTGYRDVARTFLQGLEAYEKTLQAMSPGAFCEAADALLNAREKFLKHPSYVNYFLVDCINRVLFVNLGDRLARAEDVPLSYDKIAGRLAEFRCDLSTIGNLISMEYGTDRFSMAEIENKGFEDKLAAIGIALDHDMGFLFVPSDVHNVYGLRILEKCSLSALSHRLAVSDHFVGVSLPALLLFRRKTAHFTETDSFPEIRAVLGDEARMSPTLRTHHPLATIEAFGFLDMLRSENGREQMLCFPKVPRFFTNIGELDREEAKLEAEREAKP